MNYMQRPATLTKSAIELAKEVARKVKQHGLTL